MENPITNLLQAEASRQLLINIATGRDVEIKSRQRIREARA
jgi:hypothetical protein